MAKTSEAQMRAVAKWGAANQDRIEIKVKKGTKDVWKGYCEKYGESMASLICQAVEEYVERRESGSGAPRE